MIPFFSIITPTLQRQSLAKTCESIDSQTWQSWEHVVQIDCADFNPDLIFGVAHPQRRFIQCATPHKNYGNTCRHNAWGATTGAWVLYLDDDNILNGPRVLEEVQKALIPVADWAIFPIIRHNRFFFHDPPGICYVDTANMIIRREIAQWPDGPEYTMDGIFCELLKAGYAYKAFPDFQPIVIMEISNEGR